MWDRSFNKYYKQCNMQGTRMLFSQAPVVQSAQNLIEITLAVVVGVSKRMDCRFIVEATQKYFFVSLEIQLICSPMRKTGRFIRFLGISWRFWEIY